MLEDTVFIPFCLAKSEQDFYCIKAIFLELLQKFSTFEGKTRFNNGLQNNVYFNLKISLNSSSQVNFFTTLTKEDSDLTLLRTQSSIFYNLAIKDETATLLSDDFFELQENNFYQIKLEMLANYSASVIIGVTCFDSEKRFISAFQSFRMPNSELVITKAESNAIYYKASENVQ